MNDSAKLPLVAICGRPNVGKSTLYNRIIGRQRAIIHSEVGITRDRSYTTAAWEGRAFRVVDTGGIEEQPIDPIGHKIQAQVRRALKEAAVIVFVLDGQEEITRVDEEIRDELFKYSKPVIVAVNKLDNDRLEQNRTDFYALGLGEPYAVSATHNIGMSELMEAVVSALPETAEAAPEDDANIVKVAIIGKPNVGKSSFVNALLNEERVIVDDTPGTTRDAVDIDVRWQDRDYLFIDTAGLRKKAQIRAEVEHFSVSRALRTVRRADVCLVMMDAAEGITEQDKRILNYVTENGTAMVLVWTKWDLVEDKEARFKELARDIEFKAPFLKYVPYLTISNVTKQRVTSTFDYIDRVNAEAEKRIGTGELNRLLDDLRSGAPASMHKGKSARVLYATQVSVKPTVFVVFVNQTRLFHFSYVRHIENKIRERYVFEGVPIKVELRESKGRPPEQRS